MHYVYILQSFKDLRLYIGRTDDLKRRINEHQRGKVDATEHRRPLRLVFYEAYHAKGDAIRREEYFKTSKGKSTLRMMLRESFKK